MVVKPTRLIYVELSSVKIRTNTLITMRSSAFILAVLMFQCVRGSMKPSRPKIDPDLHSGLTSQSRIIGGKQAIKDEFPWQLSLQRQSSSGSWVHSCGASLLSARYALTASHCVDGASIAIMRVLAGVHNRTDSNGIVSNIERYVMHEDYNDGESTFANDIAILTLATPIAENDVSIRYAELPDNDDDLFVGRQCVISGWGRTGRSNSLPFILQKLDVDIISTDECDDLLSPVGDAMLTKHVVCLYDKTSQTGSCNGDSGGPLNCNYPKADDERRVVYGLTSWGILDNDDNCMVEFPSIYTRVGAYLDWIA